MPTGFGTASQACGTRRSFIPITTRWHFQNICWALLSSSRRFSWATGNPLIAYNVAFLLSFVLAGAGMFLLVRELTGSSEAAWIAGLIFAFSPARFGQIGHLQVLMSGWMPLSLWALHRFITKRSALSLTGFVAFVLVQCLSNNYFIYFLALPAAIVALHGLYVDLRRRPSPGCSAGWRLRRGSSRPRWRRSPSSTFVCGASSASDERSRMRPTSAPMWPPYLHGNDGVRPPLTLWRHLPNIAKPPGPEGELFVGAVALTLAVVGMALGCGRWREPEFRNARVYGAIAAIALLPFTRSQPDEHRMCLLTSAASTNCCSICSLVSTAFACTHASASSFCSPPRCSPGSARLRSSRGAVAGSCGR